MATRRGKHQSTDKGGRRTIALLEAIPGIKAVIIGESIGGKNIGRNRAAGAFKLQAETAAGYRGILQTSKGVQQVALILDSTNTRENWQKVCAQIEAVFPGPAGGIGCRQ